MRDEPAPPIMLRDGYATLVWWVNNVQEHHSPWHHAEVSEEDLEQLGFIRLPLELIEKLKAARDMANVPGLTVADVVEASLRAGFEQNPLPGPEEGPANA